MLDEPPLLRIRREFARPPAEVMAAFRDVPAGFIVDAQNGRGSLDRAIKPLFPHHPGMDRCFGTALTCACGPDDNMALAAAVAVAKPGDVIMCSTEGFEHGACCGDLLAGIARNRGVAGIVTDGMMRDGQGLRDMGLPVFARGITPNSCVRSGPGTVGLPVVIGGRSVASGDLVIADEDGVVTVPAADIARVVAKLEQVKAAEASMLAKVKGGLKAPPWMEALLAAGHRVEWVD
ncbi:MAG: 4-hydroxy-4-methyl-2-oxoglutarate aldolase [Geminicoccaceae bacterium]